MPTLADFNPEVKTPALKDFFATGPEPAPVVNSQTISNMAAHTAIMSTDVQKSYQQVTNDLQMGSSSPSMMKVLESYDNTDYVQNFEALKGIMTDPNVSVGDKATAVTTFSSMTPKPSVDKSLADRVSQGALIAESEPDDTDEMEEVRASMSETIDTVNVYNGMIQKAINGINESSKGRPVGSWVEDFAELFVPFMEGAATAEISSKLKSGFLDKTLSTIQGLTLLGESKASIRDAMARAPLENKVKMGEMLINLIKEGQGSATLRPNVLNQLTQIEDFLYSGSYTDTDRFVDNVFSVLDDTVLLTPLKVVGKTFGRLGELASGTLTASGRADKMAIARYEASISKITPEVQGTVKATLEEGTPAMSNTLENSDKIAVRDAMADKISNQMSEGHEADVATSIRDTVKSVMNDFTPVDDLDEFSGRVVQTVKNSLSKSILGETSNDGLKASDGVLASDISRRTVKTSVSPTSVAENFNQTNPGKKRALHNSVVADQTGQLAQATYGTTRGEAIADDILPETATELGTVRNKVSVVDESGPQPAEAVITRLNEMRGDSHLDPAEKATQRTKVKDEWANVTGMVPRAQMATLGEPITLYRGVQKGKEPFDSTNTLEGAFYMSPDKAVAEEYALFPINKNTINPNQGKIGIADVQFKSLLTGKNIFDAKLKLGLEQSSTPADMIKKARELGHDGITFNSKLGQEYIVLFDPTKARRFSKAEDTDTGVSFDMVYGPKDGGFRKPSDAIKAATFNLRKYGVTPNDIELLRLNKNGEYEPTDKAGLNMNWNGNYLARVRYNYEFSPGDAISYGLYKNDPLWKMFDVVTPLDRSGQGGLLQHFIPASAIVDYAKLFKPATVAAGRAAWLTKQLVSSGTEYAKIYGKLSKRQKYLVDSYKLEANAKGIPFNTATLESRGFTEDAINTVRAWKKVWDTIYYLENLDYIKTFRSRGYGRYVDQSGDTDLYVRPASRNSVGETINAYSSETNKIEKLTAKQLDELYEGGGTIAYTRGPVDFGEELVEAVVVRQNNETSYIRRIRDDDSVLTYRHGYYHVGYTDPIFITKTIYGSDGKEFKKAIATAGSRLDAERELERLRATDTKLDNNGESVYKMRGDVKRGTSEFEDAEWSSVVESGRSSQRIRGQRLKNVSETNPDSNLTHIESPEESLVRSIYSVARRTAFRDYLETAKTRWMDKHKNLVENIQGQKMWPNNVELIGRGEGIEYTRREINDARNSWRYIDSMDSGYANLIDIWSKNFFKGFSDIAGGSKSWKWLESPLRKVSEVGPTGYARKKAFRLLLAANPLRQAPVQAMQALPVILATNPLGIPKIISQNILLNYIVTGGDVDSFFKGIAKQATGLTKAEAINMVRHYEQSGFEASVEANSLIRDQINRLADKNVMQKVSRAAGAPLNFTQKIGFNAGENFLMRTVWLSEYDNLRKAKAGAEITPADIETLSARVRDLTLNMDQAGELPYNHNTFSVLMQFFQAPHKTYAQLLLGHRGLTWQDRSKLGAAYVLTFGIGMGPMTSALSNIIPGEDKSAVRRIIEGGVFNLLLNKALSSIYAKEEVQVDFSDSFRLLEQPNLAEFVTGVMNNGLSELIAGSPSGALVFGDNPRITEFVLAAARPFYVDPNMKAQEVKNAAIEFGNIFSGMSNFFKAQYILEHQQVMSSSGVTTDYDSNSVEALMKLAGFSTMDEVMGFAMTGSIIEKRKKRDEDIKTWLRDMNKRLALEGIAREDIESVARISSEAMRVWGKDPEAVQEITRQLRYQGMAGETSLFNTLTNLSGWMKPDELREYIFNAPSNVTPEQQKLLLEYLDAIESAE